MAQQGWAQVAGGWWRELGVQGENKVNLVGEKELNFSLGSYSAVS